MTASAFAHRGDELRLFTTTDGWMPSHVGKLLDSLGVDGTNFCQALQLRCDADDAEDLLEEVAFDDEGFVSFGTLAVESRPLRETA